MIVIATSQHNSLDTYYAAGATDQAIEKIEQRKQIPINFYAHGGVCIIFLVLEIVYACQHAVMKSNINHITMLALRVLNVTSVWVLFIESYW